MTTERVSLKDLDGLSIRDSKRMPMPWSLKEWSDKGFYCIDEDLGVFKLTEHGKREISK